MSRINSTAASLQTWKPVSPARQPGRTAANERRTTRDWADAKESPQKTGTVGSAVESGAERLVAQLARLRSEGRREEFVWLVILGAGFGALLLGLMVLAQ